MDTYDLVIVGAGAAGITAAVYAGRKRLPALILTDNIGGQAALSASVENYTGYQFISGADLMAKFEEHLKGFDLETVTGIRASCIKKEDDLFYIEAGGKEYVSRSVIIATGRKPRSLKIPGELEFKNKGVTYCATCDGPLFAGKKVAVIGGGNSAMDAALSLSKIASFVYIININEELMGDGVMLSKLKVSENVEILNSTKSKRIFGERFVSGLTVEDVTGKERDLSLEGIFIQVGWRPETEPACRAEKNESGDIVVTSRCETSIEGMFAAGDVTDVPEKQIIVAAGQGCIAALSAFKYLARKKF